MKPRKRKPNPAAIRQSAASRQAVYRANKRALGLRPMEIWAFPENFAAIKEYAAKRAAETLAYGGPA